MNTPPPDRGDRAVDQRAYRLSEIDLLRDSCAGHGTGSPARLLLVAAAQDPMTSTEINPGLFADTLDPRISVHRCSCCWPAPARAS